MTLDSDRPEPARVLIVDDDRHNRHLLEVMLGPEGLILMTASSGEEALVLIDVVAPDLILLDVMMPGMDGFEVVARLKGNAKTRHIPVILVTALSDRASKLTGLYAGAEDFLSKPVDRAELCARVKNLLRLKAYADFHERYGPLLAMGSSPLPDGPPDSMIQSTFDDAPVGIAIVGLDGRCTYGNRRLHELLGLHPDDLRPDAPLALPETEVSPGERDAHERMIDGTLDRHVVDDKAYRRSDGRVVSARTSTAVHRDGAGHALHFVTVLS